MKRRTSLRRFKTIILSLILTVTAYCTSVFTTQAKSTITDSTKVEIDGRMTSKLGKTIVVKNSSRSAPMPGDTCEMQKHVQKQTSLTGRQENQFSFSAWLIIAEVEVMKVEGDRITLKLLKEKSVIHVNGEKRDHFEDGMQVKLNWMQASR